MNRNAIDTQHLLMVLNDMELDQPDVHPEFARGVINLAAELDPVIGLTTDERMRNYAAALGIDTSKWGLQL